VDEIKNQNETNEQSQQPQETPKPLTKPELSLKKRLALKRVAEISGNSEWTLLQQILHDIEAYYVIKNDKKPAVEKSIELLKEEIKTRYSTDIEEEREIRDILLEAVPSKNTIIKWRESKNWPEAVWSKARSGPTGLFSPDKRSNVIYSLYNSAVSGNVPAAKIWLTLSGDYVEKAETKNEVVEQFREINEIIHKTKKI
jgi:hypothetical protein